MTICEATSKRIEQLCRQKRLTGYSLTFQAGMPPSTIREFFDSDLFNDLDQDD